MRRVTRNALLVILAVVVVLLALGALPSLLKSGDPYYLTATSENVSVPDNATAIDVTNFSDQRFPYMTEALHNGTSDPYWKGPWGLKGSFTHSPFDELSALRGRNATADVGEGVMVTDNGTLYRLAVRQRP
jgi:hypothetical protein